MPRKKVSILYTYEQRKLTPLNTHTKQNKTTHTHTQNKTKQQQPQTRRQMYHIVWTKPTSEDKAYTLLLKRVICVSEKW